MRRLQPAIKRRIVEHLACYQTDAAVAKLIEDEFGVRLTPRHIRAYDPTSMQFAASYRYADYYRLVRDRCIKEFGGIAIAHKAYRLRQIQMLFEMALCQGNFRQAASLLEQASKEVRNWPAR